MAMAAKGDRGIVQMTSIRRLYGEEFFMRVSTFTMPWGTLYVCIELVLKYSETSHRLATGGGTFWCAVEDTFDAAMGKACAEIKKDMG